MKTIIKILSITLTALMLLSALCIGVSAADVMTVSTSSAEGERGETVDVVLTVESNPGFAALLITIPQTEGFEVVEVKNGTVMRQMTSGKNILWDSSSDSTATGTLLTVTFKIGDRAQAGENIINIKVIECFNDAFDDVSVSIAPVKINVLGEPILPVETTAEETETDETVESDTEIGSVDTETDEVFTNNVETDSENNVTATEKETEVKVDDTKEPETDDVTEEGINPDGSENGGANNNGSSNVDGTSKDDDTTEEATDVTIGGATESTKDASASEESTKADVETEKKPDKSWGCGSSVSFGALFSVVSLGALTFIKKKKDN